MDTGTQNTNSNSDTITRLQNLARVSRFLATQINDSTEESDYFIAKQSLKDFSSDLLGLPLEPQLKEDMRLFVEFLNTSLENKYKLHRG